MPAVHHTTDFLVSTVSHETKRVETAWKTVKRFTENIKPFNGRIKM